MSLSEWHRNGWLAAHRTGPREIADLLASADRDLADSAAPAVSADWRFNIAFNAALQCANAALAAAGWRASRTMHHYLLIQSLQWTVGADIRVVHLFEAFRKKRNIGTYERAGAVSESEVKGMASLAARIRARVGEWLREAHPELLERRE